jgi:hypothetical protein
MRSSKEINEKLCDTSKKADDLFNPKASARKKHDYFYAAGYRDALRWVLTHGRS